MLILVNVNADTGSLRSDCPSHAEGRRILFLRNPHSAHDEMGVQPMEGGQLQHALEGTPVVEG